MLSIFHTDDITNSFTVEMWFDMEHVYSNKLLLFE